MKEFNYLLVMLVYEENQVEVLVVIDSFVFQLMNVLEQ